jgi:anti-anti-sigma factor
MRDLLETRIRREPPIMTIELRGQLTVLAGDALMGAYRDVTSRGAHTLVLEFSGVDFMPTGGIALIIRIIQQTQAAKQRLFCVGLIPHYRKIFAMMGMDQYAPLFDTEAEALAFATDIAAGSNR